MAANDEKRRQHWAKTRNLTIVILILWAIFSFVLPWNAYDLNSISSSASRSASTSSLKVR